MIFVRKVFVTSSYDIAHVAKVSDFLAFTILSQVTTESSIILPEYLPFLQVQLLRFQI